MGGRGGSPGGVGGSDFAAWEVHPSLPGTESSQPSSPQAQLRGSYPRSGPPQSPILAGPILPRGALKPDLFTFAFQGFLSTSIVSCT